MKITAKVIKGVQIGAKFGIATANLSLADVSVLEEGVYLVTIQLGELKRDEVELRSRDQRSKTLADPGIKQYEGLLHFGARKTFGGELSAEVHILDFEKDIYGEALVFEIEKRLRDVQVFKNADALFTQIETDILVARKYFLRKQIKLNWVGLSLVNQQELSEIALRHLSSNTAFLEAPMVFAYAPQFGKEIGFVSGLMQAFPEKKYLFPRIEKGEMRFYEAAAYMDLKAGSYNILEPTSVTALIPEKNTVFMVPSMALDKSGARLGQGGGFYDRYLASLEESVKTLSVVPSFALLEKVPTEKHDQKVDQVVVCKI